MTVHAFTDGACSGNPGPGGWGVVLRWNGHERELFGGEAQTTNNRMELMAVIAGLEAVKRPCRVEIYSDSQYVLKGLKEWMDQWIKRGWRTASKQPVKNQDLWEQLDALRKKHELSFHWIRGHNEHPENERCDRMAVAAREALVLGTRP